MLMKIRKICTAVFSLIMAVSMVSCSVGSEPSVKPDSGSAAVSGKKDDNRNDDVKGADEDSSEENEETDPSSEAHNPLTGEYGYNPQAQGKRPVAVMINNISQSLPQYGISSADYIYEMVVEGGITRLMAVFADYTNVPDLCSVRSCRYYYPLVANGLDAVYCHWGMDMTIARDTLDRLGIDRFDGSDNQTLFYNDEERLKTYAREHTGCLKGSRLAESIEKAGFRTEASNGGADMMKFAEGTEFADIKGEPCEQVDIKFSASYYSTFTYDKETRTYLKQHSGSPHMDGASGKQLAFTNVFALKTSIYMRDDGYRMNVELEGGDGYYFSGGKVQKIRWEKADDSSNFRFTDYETAEEITVNRGKCYIGLTDSVSF